LHAGSVAGVEISVNREISIPCDDRATGRVRHARIFIFSAQAIFILPTHKRKFLFCEEAMLISQVTSTNNSFTAQELQTLSSMQPDLVFAFWSKKYQETPPFVAQLRQALPQAALIGCSSSGDVNAEGANDDTIVLTAIRFQHVRVRVFEEDGVAAEAEKAVGERLAAAMLGEGRAIGEPLAGVFSYGPGMYFNGGAFIQGLTESLPEGVPVSGGLAGDHVAFVKTLVLGPSGIGERKVAAVALYGKALRMRIHSGAGWGAFGPIRKITASHDNQLMEFDGESALDIYKKYLGDYAVDLPGSALLFPLELLDANHGSTNVYRAVLGVDENKKIMSLAGSVQNGDHVQFMHASLDELVDAAEQVGIDCVAENFQGPTLAMMTSCVGRKMVMGNRVDEEILVIGDQFGDNVTLAGFYSNGEVCPDSSGEHSALNNQTLVVALLTENE
jgi:hypothetical protein